MKLTELADIIRSKNSGPYELTLDVMFKTQEDFERVWNANAISEQVICRLYRITPDKIVNIVAFPPAKAIKVTIERPICSGDPGETDVYGAQQHAPLLTLEVDI
jgi:hypothetical protein